MKFKSFIIAAICVMVQYYDYHLFAYLAAKIGDSFFASEDSIKRLSNTFLIMFLGYLAKPFAAIILGRVGDIYGRFTTVIISLSGTALGSILISIIPTYEKIDILSAYFLLLCRMMISGLVSTGTDGIRLYIYEHIGSKKQCMGNGLITGFTQTGSLIASLSAGFFTLGFMPDYAWRFAFILGGIMGLFAIFLRLYFKVDDEEYISKQPDYEYYKDKKTLKIAFKNIKLLLACAILGGSIGSTNQFLILWFGTFSFDILQNISESKMRFFISIGIVLNIIFAVIGGLAADKFGRKIIVNISGLVSFILSLILMYFSYINQFSPLTFLSICCTVPFMTMPALAVFKESIPTAMRYRIFSLSHAIGSITISGSTGLICTNLYKITLQGWVPLIHFSLILLQIIIVVNYLSNNTNLVKK